MSGPLQGQGAAGVVSTFFCVSRLNRLISIFRLTLHLLASNLGLELNMLAPLPRRVARARGRAVCGGLDYALTPIKELGFLVCVCV